jgi:hypothetical protein
MRVIYMLFAVSVTMAVLGSCVNGSSPDTSSPSQTLSPTARPSPIAVSPSPTSSSSEVQITVFQSPQCGCCGEYKAYLQEEGFQVEARHLEDMASLKRDHQVPQEMWSCHTSIVGGYFVEGHVPVEAIEKLLRERPAIRGIALPGMPSGSPGMGGAKEEPFKIYALSDGPPSLFMTY